MAATRIRPESEDLCSRPYVGLDLVADQILGARPPQAHECYLRSARSGARRIEARLLEFDFALDDPAFCSVLGVTQYIDLAAVEGLMRFVASLKRGSEIVFSYVPRAEELAGPDRELASTSAQRAEFVGETWKTRFSTSELIAHLEHSASAASCGGRCCSCRSGRNAGRRSDGRIA